MKSAFTWESHINLTLHLSQHHGHWRIVQMLVLLLFVVFVVFVCCSVGVSRNDINLDVVHLLKYSFEDLPNRPKRSHRPFIMVMAFTTSCSLQTWSGHQLPFLGVSNTVRRRHEIVLDVTAFNDWCNRFQIIENRISCPLTRISEWSFRLLAKLHLKDRCVWALVFFLTWFPQEICSRRWRSSFPILNSREWPWWSRENVIPGTRAHRKWWRQARDEERWHASAIRAPWQVFLASYSLHQTQGWCRVGRMPKLHRKSFHGAAQRFVSVCSLCEHHSVVCRCRRYFRRILTLTLTWIQFLLLLGILSPHKHHLIWSFLGSLCKRNLEVFRKKASFSLVCKNVLHKVDKKALCSIRVLKTGWISTSSNLPGCTAAIRVSALAEAFVKQSGKQFWVRMWARSWIFPEEASFRNMEIMWMVFFVQGGELFLRQLPGSLHQFSCGFLPPHQIDPSKIYRETGMNQNTS